VARPDTQARHVGAPCHRDAVRLALGGEAGIAHGRIVLENLRWFRDTAWLMVHWSVTRDGLELASGDVPMPAIPPGRTDELALPREAIDAASADPQATGERWLTLSFRTAADEPWADAGHEVGWQQIRMPGDPVRGTAAIAASPASPLGTDGLPSHPLLSVAPAISLWRAPTDNDRIHGLAADWAAMGVDALERRLLSVERQDEGWLVTADLLTGSGAVVRHERMVRVLEGGGLSVEEHVVIPDELEDLPRVGTVLEVVAGLDQVTGSAPGPTRPTLTGGWRASVGTQRRSRTWPCPTSGPRRTGDEPRCAGWSSPMRQAGVCASCSTGHARCPCCPIGRRTSRRRTTRRTWRHARPRWSTSTRPIGGWAPPAADRTPCPLSNRARQPSLGVDDRAHRG